MKAKRHIGLVLLALCLTNWVSSTFGQSATAASGINQPQIKSQNRRELNVVAMSLQQSLESGAYVYVCTALKREISPASDRGIERGTVTLSVTKTLRGPKRELFVLPYSVAIDLIDGKMIWPPF